MTRSRIHSVFLTCVISSGVLLPGAAMAQSTTSPTTVPTVAASPTVASPPSDVRQELARLRAELDALRAQYDQRITAIEERIGDLVAAAASPSPRVLDVPAFVPPAPPVAPTPQDAAPAAQAPAANMAGAAKAFNPDMSVIGNFVGAAGKNPNSDQPSLQLSEAEMSFQAVVDPYARADFFLSAGPGGLSIEEGFLTFNALPGGFLAKVGQMRAQFGKVNTMHSHALPWVDRPLVTQNLVGGEDGLDDAGVSLSRIIPVPAVFLEATGGVFRSDSAVFQGTGRSNLSYVGRIRAYRDITEGSNIDFGTSVALGPADLGALGQNATKRLIDVDATFRYRPLRRAIYKRFQLRTELIWSRQDIPLATSAKAFGLYASAEYQFARRWFAGVRLDESGRTLAPTIHDKGGSLFLTYWPSEFSQIRTQYRRTDYGHGPVANELLFQFNFAIGAHGAHVF